LDLEKTSESSDSQWRRLDLRVPLVLEVTLADKDLEATMASTEDPDCRVCRARRVRPDKLRQPPTWTPSRPSLPKETKPEAEQPESDSCRLKWDPWDLAVPLALRDPQELLDSLALVVTPEIRDRSDNAVLAEL